MHNLRITIIFVSYNTDLFRSLWRWCLYNCVEQRGRL